MYRKALRTRRESLMSEKEIHWCDKGGEGLLVFERGEFLILLNTAQHELSYSADGELLLASDSGVRLTGGQIYLPRASACWIKKN